MNILIPVYSKSCGVEQLVLHKVGPKSFDASLHFIAYNPVMEHAEEEETPNSCESG